MMAMLPTPRRAGGCTWRFVSRRGGVLRASSLLNDIGGSTFGATARHTPYGDEPL